MIVEDFSGIFRDYIIELIEEAINNIVDATLDDGVGAGLTYLKEVYEDEGKKGIVSSSPLLKVIKYSDVDTDKYSHFITLLFRGKKSFGSFGPVFLRSEIKLSIKKEDNTKIGNCDIELISLMGDLTMKKDKVYEAAVGFGVSDKTLNSPAQYLVGHGKLKLLPPNGFGLDVKTAFSQEGFYMDIGLDIPTPIPLGITGLGLAGVNGLFAHNFEPNIDNPHPTAKEYASWAHNNEIDSWKPDRDNVTSTGIGLGADLISLSDNGKLFSLRPVGLSLLLPGPVFILGGKGKIIGDPKVKIAGSTNLEEYVDGEMPSNGEGLINIEGYFVVDINPFSLAMDLKTNMNVLNGSKIKLIKASGILQSYFSAGNPSDWYINFGTKNNPIACKMIAGLITAQMYLMMNSKKIQYGSSLAINLQGGFWKIKFFVIAGAKAYASIGRNPTLIEAELAIWAEIGIRLWRFKYSHSVEIKVGATIPKPSELSLSITIKIDLPWPLSDKKGTSKFTLGDSNPKGIEPELKEIISNDIKDKRVGLLHELSGTQWKFNDDGVGICWPDASLAVLFDTYVTSKNDLGVEVTNIKIINPESGKSKAGEYTVLHNLTKLSILDEYGENLEKLSATWVNGSGGNSDKLSRLHILSKNPYSWLTPHIDASTIPAYSSIKVRDQFFGVLPRHEVISIGIKKDFNDISILSETKPLEIITLPIKEYKTRTIKLDNFSLTFENDIVVNKVILYFILQRSSGKFYININKTRYIGKQEGTISSNKDYYLYSVTIDNLNTNVLHIEKDTENYLHLQWLRYYQKDSFEGKTDCRKTILKPGFYKLLIEGEALAQRGDDYAKASNTWKIKREFEVVQPNSIRSYIEDVTIGDSRIFGKGKSIWNPTVYGYGFPIYKKYKPIINFKVPYMSEIFPKLSVQLIYEKDFQEVNYNDLIPEQITTANVLAEGALEEWNSENCIYMQNNEKLEIPALIESGPANIKIYNTSTNEKLDEWACLISKFNSFSEHVTLKNKSLTTSYSKDGKRVLSNMRVINTPLLRRRTISRGLEKQISNLSKERILVRKKPIEYTNAPASWQQKTGEFKLNAQSGLSFIHFAQKCNIHLNNIPTADSLYGINSIVTKTTIEVLNDEQNRPYTLWLRTPEPLDWSRVKAELIISHTLNNDHSKLLNREALKLDIKILPSLDATSAFLVGFFNKKSIVLPRGNYQLNLEFNLAETNLVKLESDISSNSKEKVLLKFTQPFGMTWPLPTFEVEELSLWKEYKDLLEELYTGLKSLRIQSFSEIKQLGLIILNMKKSKLSRIEMKINFEKSVKVIISLESKLRKAKRLIFFGNNTYLKKMNSQIKALKVLQERIKKQNMKGKSL